MSPDRYKIWTRATDGDGHIREAAVAEMAASLQPEDLPHLLVRANDWVPVIAKQATALCTLLLDRSGAWAWEHHLDALAHMLLTRRSALAQMLRDRLAALGQGGDLELFQRILGLAEADARFAAAVALLAAVAVDSPLYLAYGERVRLAGDCRLQHFILKNLSDETLLKAYSTQPLASVRLKALRQIAATGASQATTSLETGLFDRSGGVRTLARFELKKRGVSDLARNYRSRLTVATKGVVLLGLGETGDVADLDLIEPFLRHPQPTLRLSAWRAYHALHAGAKPPRVIDPAALLTALEDPSTKVRRELMAQILASVSLPTTAELLGQIAACGIPAVRCDLIWLATKRSAWDALLQFLDYWPAASDEVRSEIYPIIVRSLREGGGEPTVTQRAALTEALASPKPSPLVEYARNIIRTRRIYAV